MKLLRPGDRALLEPLLDDPDTGRYVATMCGLLAFDPKASAKGLISNARVLFFEEGIAFCFVPKAVGLELHTLALPAARGKIVRDAFFEACIEVFVTWGAPAIITRYQEKDLRAAVFARWVGLRRILSTAEGWVHARLDLLDWMLFNPLLVKLGEDELAQDGLLALEPWDASLRGYLKVSTEKGFPREASTTYHELRSHLGIPHLSGVASPHGVLDDDRPLTEGE